ncbi:MAG: class I SAM-dependent methyltransferase [Candidatus Diapherotrites archaeon]|nr:class I SAM-dependent methyltransferase [Candidatus Diapherotrites archaeon]
MKYFKNSWVSCLMSFMFQVRFLEKIACEKRDKNILTCLQTLLDGEKTALDVGCGSGRFSKKIVKKFRIELKGIDISIPKNPAIKVILFDGKKIPFKDESFDIVFLIDVLHHVHDSKLIFDEAIRVAKKSIIVKDHYFENSFDLAALKIADFIGNFGQKTPFPFYFKSMQEWNNLLSKHKHKQITWKSTLVPKIPIKQLMFKIQVSDEVS